jgi:hypothetical protein
MSGETLGLHGTLQNATIQAPKKEEFSGNWDIQIKSNNFPLYQIPVL